MPSTAKQRILKQLDATDVPKKLVERLRSQITGNNPSKGNEGQNK